MPENTNTSGLLEQAISAQRLDAPEPFACPYKKQCWSREAARWLIPALLALLVSHLSGCTGAIRLRGFPPGVSTTISWSDSQPMTDAIAAVPSPATTKPTK